MFQQNALVHHAGKIFFVKYVILIISTAKFPCECVIYYNVAFPCFSCTRKCFENFTDEDQMDIISILYDGKSKKEKDLYLMGRIENSPVQRRRSRQENFHCSIWDNIQTSLSHLCFARKKDFPHIQSIHLLFGRPKAKIKYPFPNENAKRVAVAELLVHKRPASKFYKKNSKR